MKEGAPVDDEAKAINAVVELARLVLKRPIIIGAAGKEVKEGLPAYGFAILDAGPRKAEIASAIAKLERLIDEDNRTEIIIGNIKMRGLKDFDKLMAYWGWVGDRFVFAMNDGEGLAMKYLQGNINRPMPDYFAGVQGTANALAVYIDREKVLKVFEVVASMEGDEDEFSAVKTAIRELGLANITTVTARMGFSGPDMISERLYPPAPLAAVRHRRERRQRQENASRSSR